MLSKLEKKFKIDAKYFVKNSFWLTFRHVVTIILGVAMGMIFSRYVSKEVFGDYQLLLSFMTSIFFLSLPGFNKAIWADASIGNDGSLKVSTGYKTKWSLLGSLVLLILAAKYYVMGDFIFGLSLSAMAIAFPLYTGPSTWSAFLMSKNKYKLSTELMLFAEIANKISIILAIMFFKESLLFIVIAMVGSTALTNVVCHKISERETENQKVSKDFVEYGFFVTKTSIIQGILDKIDSILIGIFMGPVHLAIYTFALIIPQQLTNFISSVMDVIIPKLGSHEKDAILAGVGKKKTLLLTMNILLIMAVIPAIPFVINILFTDNYSDSIIYAQIITASLFVYVFETFYSRFLLVKKYKKEILQTNLVMPIFRSVVIIISFLWLGMIGVAASHTITRLFNVGVYMLLAKNIKKEQCKESS